MANAMSREETVEKLKSASSGFDHLFANDLNEARQAFSEHDSPFHQLGLGVCAFLEAALGMEADLMPEATRCLGLSEAGAKKQRQVAKYATSTTRFPPGTEWELLHSDAIILHGLTHALSESYMGYLQCLYALNSGHSKFTKLYKLVFPNGLDSFATPATSKSPSPSPSIHSATSSVSTTKSSSRFGFLGRLGGSSLSVPSMPVANTPTPDGPLEDLIISGTAFGYGLFNLVFSLLPAAVRGVVGILGYKSDRKLALRALAVSANYSDVHSVFAGLVLMTYYGVVLLLAGYQADEKHILKQYSAIVENLSTRYPNGSLWILNRAKILRMSHDTPGAIQVLQDGLRPDRPLTFVQADGLLIFELAWTLLSQRRYQEAADTFMKMTEINSWSHATYYFIAAGCHVSLENFDRAQKLLDAIPDLVDKKKLGGKDLPTEVLIKKKLTFYKEKQKRKTGSYDNYVQCIKISPAEELGIFWNSQARVDSDIAQAHISELAALSPPLTISSPFIPDTLSTVPSSSTDDLDTPDELAIRSLILGIVHRAAGEYEVSRAFLNDAHKQQPNIRTSTWVGGVAMFELAVLDLKETEARVGSDVLLDQEMIATWHRTLKAASDKLDQALALAPQSVDLSSRLDTRINMLRDEIGLKREMVGQTV